MLTSWHSIGWIFLLCAGSLLGAHSAAADSIHEVTEQTEIYLLAADGQLAPDASEVLFGLEFVLQPDWKIYWHTPGAGGRPPVLHWQSDSANVANLTIRWPFPERFHTYGLLSNGYSDRVILPLIVEPRDPTQPIRLALKVDFFICKDICIPDSVILTRTMQPGMATSALDAPRIEAALQQVPRIEGAMLSVAPPEALSGHEGRLRIDWQITSLKPIAELQAFFDAENGEFSEPLLVFTPERTSLTLSTEAGGLEQTQPIALVLAARFTDEETLFYSRHQFPAVLPDSVSWGWVLLLAFAGGLMINVMPCVLPVLMLKLFGALTHPEQNPRRGFAAMAAGMTTAFGVLGLAFAALRSAGGSLYWGAQFQQPIFLNVMVFVLVAFAAGLLGWWTLRLPSFLTSRLPATGGGGREFFTGIIATILATPCSAPLVGVSISLALFLPPSATVLILLVMGLGMASPYLLLAANPALLRWLPEPGRWIEVVKLLLALSVLGTALWVLWLLGGLIGHVGAATSLVLAALMFLSLATVRFPDTKIAPQRWKLALLLLVLGLALPGRFALPAEESKIPPGWQAFAPQNIPRHIADGKTVLVDVSADWCLSCLLNDRWVFDQPEVRAWREHSDVVAMRGDWSRPDHGIEEFLARFQRRSLPFAVLFTPHAPEGMLLPELVRMSDFREMLVRMRASPLEQEIIQ